ncbi:MAG: methyl-accepting chemotaxis protein [Desulfuromusa sp.]
MFDNLKIGNKLFLLSGTILLLLAATVIWAALGLSTAVDNGSQAAFGNKLSASTAHLEIQHDRWNEKVRDFLSDPIHHDLKVETDPAQCGLGKWYYGKERKAAEKMLPQLKAELAAMEEPHRLMHQSAKKIKEAYIPADPELPGILNVIEKNHLAWAITVQSAMLNHDEKIDAHADHKTCSMGKFLASEKARAAAQRDPELAQLLKKIVKPHKRLHDTISSMNEALRANDRVTLYEIYNYQFAPSLVKVRSLLDKMLQVSNNRLKGLHQAEEIYKTETQPNLAKLKQHLQNVEKIVSAETISDQVMISAAQNARNGVIAVGIAALLIGMGLAFMISRSLTVPMKKTVTMLNNLEGGHLDSRLRLQRTDEIGQLAETMDHLADSLQNEIVDSLQKLANGDLTFSVTPRDEGDLLRGSLLKLGNDLNEIMAQIQTASGQIDSGSNQVSQSAQDLSDGAAQSAASVEEISSSITEIDSQIKTTAANAEEANTLATSARSSAHTGSERMVEMIAAMEEINQAGNDIGKIIKVIDEIAFQTNLLALNAAVEAARAGQHGKGFAVVAEEVRNLAARSAKAAAETAELIEGSVEKTTNGTEIAERTSSALEEIVGSIGKVTDLIGEIAAASHEQSEGISQVNIGIQQIDSSIQQNTATAEESAATSEELSSQAGGLKHQLNRFKLKDSYNQSSSPAPTPQLSLSTQNNTAGWGSS